MDLKIQNELFLVCGASSGLGRAVAESLLQEQASIIAIARTEEKLKELKRLNPDRVEYIHGDLYQERTMDEIFKLTGQRKISGVFINSGGPPASSFMETTLKSWDSAYHQLVRWKIDLVKRLIPLMEKQGYGRLLFSESVSVKQPVENLVLSNSMRMAVVGAAKTLSQEIAGSGITVNILAPGYHETNALKRLYRKKSESKGITEAKAREEFIESVPVGYIGKTVDYASIAIWLLSPHSSYITGQTFSIDGGIVGHAFG